METLHRKNAKNGGRGVYERVAASGFVTTLRQYTSPMLSMYVVYVRIKYTTFDQGHGVLDDK